MQVYHGFPINSDQCIAFIGRLECYITHLGTDSLDSELQIIINNSINKYMNFD